MSRFVHANTVMMALCFTEEAAEFPLGSVTITEGNPMTLTIELSDEQATVLEAKAAAEGLSVAEWIQKLLQPALPVSQARRHIADIIVENMKDVPPEIMATMPNDGASQHDHYIYGLPKKKE